MSTGKLLKVNFLAIFIVAVLPQSFISCGKEKEKESDVPPPLKASAIVNGAFTSLPETDLKVTFQDGQVVNRVTLTRFGGIKITLRIPGTSRGNFDLLQGGSAIPGATLTDQQQRNYITRSGRVNVSDYYNRDGLYRISGAFEFRGELFINDSTTFEVNVTQGGFVNVDNTLVE